MSFVGSEEFRAFTTAPPNNFCFRAYGVLTESNNRSISTNCGDISCKISWSCDSCGLESMAIGDSSPISRTTDSTKDDDFEEKFHPVWPLGDKPCRERVEEFLPV